MLCTWRSNPKFMFNFDPEMNILVYTWQRGDEFR